MYAVFLEHRRDGLLVPSSIMVTLLKAAIVAGDGDVSGKSERFLIDGFPRSKENLEAWFKAFSDDEIQVVRSDLFVLFHFLPFRSDPLVYMRW